VDQFSGGHTERFSERERAALSYAEAITWRLEPDDSFWDRLRSHFSEEEMVELACFIALTMGQQSWIRLLNIDHRQVMAETAASLMSGPKDDATAGSR
jgi:alkylhydroperoxidase family enzyme